MGDRPQLLGKEDIGRVRVLRLMRPNQHNALSQELAALLEAALLAADQDAKVGAIVLCAEGESFCTGGDLDEFAALSALDPGQLYTEGRVGIGLFALHETMQTPLLAAVHGHVLAGGMGLLLLAHIALSAPQTQFGLPEIELGFFPYTVLPLLARAIGARRALELALSGRRFDEQEALSLGLIHGVVDRGDLVASTISRAQEMAERDPLAVRTGLGAYQAVAARDMDQLFEHLLLLRNLALGAPALRQSVSAMKTHRQGSGR